ncbi:UNVERIFIED_CONTAM: Mitochondrial succinate-fumarate transporter 1 [Sesamum angustifolium]|uniref:Mitochondrial succinate-fumarate transporter 1 n=1 Tax=Sesamum angustifolium TaxID=2727405 RepID=A0AAW2N6Q6_9LAMI
MAGKSEKTSYMKALSGSLGGIVEASCLQPIDVIKTRLQLDRSGAYKGIIHCGTTITNTEGVRALWKGLTPFATHLTLKYALRMGSNAVLQSAFKDSQTGDLSHQGRLLSGFGAGVLEALVIVTPFELSSMDFLWWSRSDCSNREGLSPELLKYKGPIHCARMIIREEGLFGLWAGDGKVLQPWQSMISGFLAGTAGPVCTGPFDVVKTRLMAQTRSGGELKYKEALQLVVSECKPKAKIVDVCEKGDAFIREQTGNMYKNAKKKIERGVAFPTCISVNNTVCHFSPLASDETVLEDGDIVKVDMGCHIDGFIAVVAHTHVIQQGPVTGRAADVIAAANTAAEVALRLVRPGKKDGLFPCKFRLR